MSIKQFQTSNINNQSDKAFNKQSKSNQYVDFVSKIKIVPSKLTNIEMFKRNDDKKDIAVIQVADIELLHCLKTTQSQFAVPLPCKYQHLHDKLTKGCHIVVKRYKNIAKIM